MNTFRDSILLFAESHIKMNKCFPHVIRHPAFVVCKKLEVLNNYVSFIRVLILAILVLNEFDCIFHMWDFFLMQINSYWLQYIISVLLPYMYDICLEVKKVGLVWKKFRFKKYIYTKRLTEILAIYFYILILLNCSLKFQKSSW